MGPFDPPPPSSFRTSHYPNCPTTLCPCLAPMVLLFTPALSPGVVWVILGQSVIKGVAFACNDWALDYLAPTSAPPRFWPLILSATFAGFMTSFFVSPLERVKVVVQAAPPGPL